jgi:hypothetical protein
MPPGRMEWMYNAAASEENATISRRLYEQA